MARIQILELPAGDNDDQPPFALVVDQATEVTVATLGDHEGRNPMQRLLTASFAQQLGARAVLCFEETIDIPANEVPVDPDGYPLKIRVEPDFDQFRQQVQAEIRKSHTQVTRALDEARLANERTDTARDADRLAMWKNALTDAIGMDRLRDWDDIRNAATGLRNAAAGLREQRDHLHAIVDTVRALHKPVDYNGRTICAECSAYDTQGVSTDNAPLLYTDCATIKALGKLAETQPEAPEQR